MAERTACRRASRRGGRLARKRLAKRLGTTTRFLNGRILTGYEKPVMRCRPEGWLTLTAAHLLRTHLSLNGKVCQILPVTRIAVELNRFAFMAMDDPAVKRWQYQKGPLHGCRGIREPWRISQAVSQPRHWT